ncbi:MAG: hypothetical protein R3E73_12555 [Porticoccaceae bacterium]
MTDTIAALNCLLNDSREEAKALVPDVLKAFIRSGSTNPWWLTSGFQSLPCVRHLVVWNEYSN